MVPLEGFEPSIVWLRAKCYTIKLQRHLVIVLRFELRTSTWEADGLGPLPIRSFGGVSGNRNLICALQAHGNNRYTNTPCGTLAQIRTENFGLEHLVAILAREYIWCRAITLGYRFPTYASMHLHVFSYPLSSVMTLITGDSTYLVQVWRIELQIPTWKEGVLPLNDTCIWIRIGVPPSTLRFTRAVHRCNAYPEYGTPREIWTPDRLLRRQLL